MNILDKIDRLEQEMALVESGIRNIKALSKEFQKAKIYFHKDLDGITSAIAMKHYLEMNRIKVVECEPIQYGSDEYRVLKPSGKDILPVLVDFAHGKPMMKIHTDHHDHQVGVDKGTSTSFAKTPSNAQSISDTISPSPIFSSSDIDVISTVDNADFSRFGLTPDDIARAVFNTDKSVDVSKNHQMMGLVVNKLALTYKNKSGFLASVVMQSKPSLISMFNVIVKLAKEAGYKAPEEIDAGSAKYKEQRTGKAVKNGKPSDIPGLGNGESIMVGTTVFQKGGGAMAGANVYDRYTIFSVYPDSDYLITQWPMGLVQVSANPFAKKTNKYHLGDIVMKKVLPKFSGELKGEMVTLDYVKYVFERDIKKLGIKGAVGFKWADFVALFADKIKGLESKSDSWPNMIKDITDKQYSFLSPKQKEMLKKITISAWDLIMASSGGHKSITNLSGLMFLKDTKGFMNRLSVEISKEMEDKHLG